jgi:hypothetical protein
MADVTVEFGATDTGLEKTLKAVQDELTQLKGKVSSGELSMTELESTMKRIGQVESMEKRIKAIGDASSESSPKIKNLGDSIESTGDKTKNVGGIFDEEFKRMGAAFTVGNLAAEGFQKAISLVFDAATKVVQGFSDALDLGGRLSELSTRTGEAAGTLLVLETAFKNSGLEASQVGQVINKLQNFMQDAANGGEKQTKAMSDLGISMADLAGKTPTEQMEVFAKKIAAIEDPTQRAATASEAFGEKLGGKLLPLLVDFSGNIEDARSKVGSLEQVMNENADTFDKFSESIDAIKGKMAAFAAGVLSETIPAVKDLGKSMEQVDAAGLGKDVGEFLSPRLEKLSFVTIGTSKAVKELIDLFTTAPSSTSAFGKAVNAVAESLAGFNYYMQKAINFISPMDDLYMMLEQKGRDAAESQDTAGESIKGVGVAAQTAATELQAAATDLQDVGTESETAAGKVNALGTSAQSAGENIASAFSITSDFVPKLDNISGSWGGVNEQILEGKNLLSDSYNLADSITGKIDEQNIGFEGVNDQLTVSQELNELILDTTGKIAEKEKESTDKAAKKTEEQQKSNELKQAELSFQLELAEAQAAGDSARVKALQEQKKYADDFAEAIAAGMDEEQATDFASRIAEAASNSQNIVTTDKDGNPLFFESAKATKSMSENLASATGFAQTLANMKQIEALEKGNNTAKAARLELKAMDQILGTDLAAKSFPDIVKKLNIDKLGMTGSEQIKAVVDYMNGVKTNLSKNPIDSKAGKAAIDEVKNSINKSPFQGKLAMDSSEAKAKTSSAFSKFSTTLDAEKSVKGIRDSVKNGIELDVAAKSSVNGLLDAIKTAVEAIKTTVEKIEPKLPTAALSA